MNDLVTIAQKLWKPARTLQQESGLSCYDYLTELTWVLFLKLAPLVDSIAYLSIHLVWETLLHKHEQQQFDYYRAMLTVLGQANNPKIAGLYAQAVTHLTQPSELTQIIKVLDLLNRLPLEDIGEIYEILLERCARQSNLFILPPRILVDTLVILTQPQADELIYDPLAGTASFLVAADQYRRVTCEDASPSTHLSLVGAEPNLTLQRFALMNGLLHHFKSVPPIAVHLAHSVTSPPDIQADVILSLLLTTGETQPDDSILLLRHILQTLKPGGRAAVIVPDTVLNSGDSAQQLRRDLMDICTVHTVLRLPLGIFYPHTSATQVVFFQRGEKQLVGNTQKTWFYDLRSQLPAFGQYLQLTRQHLTPFESYYGDDPFGQAPRPEEENTPGGCLSREFIATQDERLDFSYSPETREKPQTGTLQQVMDTTLKDLGNLVDILL